MKYTIPSVVNSRLQRRQPRMCPTPQNLLLLQTACQCPLVLLCFQSFPTIKFCNPFVLITIQIAGGWAYAALPHTPWISLSSLECAVPRFRVLSPLECADPKTPRRNPFRMRSSEKRWGVGIPLQQEHSNNAPTQAGGTPKQNEGRSLQGRFFSLFPYLIAPLLLYFGFWLGGIPPEGGAKAAGCYGAKRYVPQPGRQG